MSFVKAPILWVFLVFMFLMTSFLVLFQHFGTAELALASIGSASAEQVVTNSPPVKASADGQLR